MHRSLLIKSSIFLALLVIVLTSSPLLIGNDTNNDGQAIEIEGSTIPSTNVNNSAFIRNEVSKEVDPENITNNDLGSDDISLELNVPSVLPLYSTLVCEVDILNIGSDFNGVLTWYLDDEVVQNEAITADSEISGISIDFEYTRSTVEEASVRVTLTYKPEQKRMQIITAEETVIIENYGKKHWIELEAPRVLEEVTSRYAGNRTLQWAIDNDYDDFDKEVFVNTMGYESETEYLLWVSRSHQRLNVFTKSSDVWELIETFIISTGARGTATRRGVTTIPSRTAEGWHFEGYFVRPVVRFFPGTGYAFHSRLLRYGAGGFRDSRIGFPVSAGCIRMYCDDVWYIYNNIPDGTTVVIH